MRPDGRGREGEAPQCQVSIEGLRAAVVLTDAAFDSDLLPDITARKRAKAAFPDNPLRTHDLDRALATGRPSIE